MSAENLEIVRGIYEGDGDVSVEFTSDAEYVNPPEAIEAGVRRGRDEVIQAFLKPSETFDTTRYEVHDLIAAGDKVVGSISFCARTRGSDAEVIQKEVHTWTFRDGRIARFEWGRDLKAALEAAGLPE